MKLILNHLRITYIYLISILNVISSQAAKTNVNLTLKNLL